MHARTRLTLCVAATLGLAAVRAAGAPLEGAPGAPARDTVVETQLAPREVKAQLARLQAGAAAAAAAPAAERIAAARGLIAAARSSGDPRLLGYAEAELGGSEEVEAQVLRATIAQSQHRFDAARALLDRALQRAPAHAQARLTRASIAQVQGRHGDALRDCAALSESAPAAAQVCRAVSEAATGQAQEALQRLASAAHDARLRGWAWSVAGEIQLQRGDPAALETLRAALAVEDDLYTRVALADALLDAGDVAGARRVLDDAPATDAVLLRRWLAARQQRLPDEALAHQLEARFAVDAARGVPLHAREAARFALARGQAAEALRLARINWASQREAADALVLAAAAQAARDASALRELHGWLAASGLRDVRIDRILRGGAA